MTIQQLIESDLVKKGIKPAEISEVVKQMAKMKDVRLAQATDGCTKEYLAACLFVANDLARPSFPA